MDGMYEEYERVWQEYEQAHDEEYQELLEWFRESLPQDKIRKDVPEGLQAIFFQRMVYWAGRGDTPTLDDLNAFIDRYLASKK